MPFVSSASSGDTLNIATFFLDDNQDALDLIKDTIDRAGIKNYHLYTDEDKFLAGLTDDIHICVVDHGLTKRTGLDILDEVKSKNEGSFFIAYTIAFDSDIIIDYLNRGADRFIDKNKDNSLELLTRYLKDGFEIGMKRIEYASYLRTKRDRLISHD